MRAVRAKKVNRELKRAGFKYWDRYLTNVASWPFRARFRFARLILFPPKRHRKSAAEQKVIAARKKKRQKRKAKR